jgi:hypothetical protein
MKAYGRTPLLRASSEDKEVGKTLSSGVFRAVRPNASVVRHNLPLECA